MLERLSPAGRNASEVYGPTCIARMHDHPISNGSIIIPTNFLHLLTTNAERYLCDNLSALAQSILSFHDGSVQDLLQLASYTGFRV